MNPDHYLLLIGSEQKGPYALSQLQTMWRSGSITADTLYWQHGFDEWVPISLITDILDPPQEKAPAYAPATAATGPKSDALGVILFLLPLGSAALMWFWISGMNLLQNPSSTLSFIVIGTILLTATLMAVEASQLGMGAAVKGKRTTGPVGWFLCALLLWIVAYPAYLYSRSRFGVTNYVVGGLVSALVFLGVALTLNTAIESQKASVRRNLEESQEKLRELQRSFERFSR